MILLSCFNDLYLFLSISRLDNVRTVQTISSRPRLSFCPYGICSDRLMLSGCQRSRTHPMWLDVLSVRSAVIRSAAVSLPFCDSYLSFCAVLRPGMHLYHPDRLGLLRVDIYRYSERNENNALKTSSELLLRCVCLLFMGSD